MKLIIDIPEEDYNYVKKQVADGITNPLKVRIADGTPLDDVKAEINEEREFARDDFTQYKIDYLGVDPETADDEYPNDEFHEGMERALEIINTYMRGGKE